jgi:hypothetical protein
VGGRGDACAGASDSASWCTKLTDQLSGFVAALVVAVFSWWGAMSLATAQQDREARKREKGTARALLADLDRIELELTTNESSGGPPLRTPPQIHSWVEGLITQIAENSPDTVAGFMILQRKLAELRNLEDSQALQMKQLIRLHADFDAAEAHRLLDHVRGPYNPLTDTYDAPRPPETVPLVPDVLPMAAVGVPGNQELVGQALRKQGIGEIERELSRTHSDAAATRRYARETIVALRRALIPKAERAIPTLPGIVFGSFRVSEDADIERREDEEVLRRFEARR